MKKSTAAILFMTTIGALMSGVYGVKSFFNDLFGHGGRSKPAPKPFDHFAQMAIDKAIAKRERRKTRNLWQAATRGAFHYVQSTAVE